MSVSMYTPIKLGYKDKKSQIDEMKKYGYYRDDSLSNDNEQVYWNPTKKKLLYNVTGTHNLSDWGTDVYLGTGRLKQTNRYKEADDILAKSKAKYGVKKATIVGHSLGGSVSNGIAKGNDKVYTLDAGYTIGEKARDNVKNYRTKGDIVSTFSPSQNTTTLTNPNATPQKWFSNAVSGLGMGIGALTARIGNNAIQAHDVDNIKNTPIKVDKNKGRYNTDYGIKYVNLVD